MFVERSKIRLHIKYFPASYIEHGTKKATQICNKSGLFKKCACQTGTDRIRYECLFSDYALNINLSAWCKRSTLRQLCSKEDWIIEQRYEIWMSQCSRQAELKDEKNLPLATNVNVGLLISGSTLYLLHGSNSFQEPATVMCFYVKQSSALSIQALRVSASKNRPILPNPMLSRGDGFLTSRIPNQKGCDITKN